MTRRLRSTYPAFIAAALAASPLLGQTTLPGGWKLEREINPFSESDNVTITKDSLTDAPTFSAPSLIFRCRSGAFEGAVNLYRPIVSSLWGKMFHEFFTRNLGGRIKYGSEPAKNETFRVSTNYRALFCTGDRFQLVEKLVSVSRFAIEIQTERSGRIIGVWDMDGFPAAIEYVNDACSPP